MSTGFKEEFIDAVKQLVVEKGISEEMLFTTIEDALVAAYKKNFAKSHAKEQNVRVWVNRDTGETHVYSLKEVVEEVYDDVIEISLEDAREISAKYNLEDIAEIEVTPRDFGRVAAQAAKQVVIQRIKEAERTLIYNEFITKEFDIITGIVLRKDRGNVFIDLGKLEAVLGPNEQMPGESYIFNEKLKLYIVEVKKSSKGPQIVVSRTHPGLVKRLFELEVPEKIDIIKWSKLPEEYIAHALSPAKVLSVDVDEDGKSAKVVVDDNQLSLAIGKEGQNVRLAARLTGWKIDIKSKSQAESLQNEESNL